MSAGSNTLTAPDTIAQLAVGARATSGPGRPVADILTAAGIILPPGSPLLGNAVAEALSPPIGPSLVTRVALQWTEPAPPRPDTVVRAESLVTRVQSDALTVQRHVRLLDDAGTIRAEGSETWRLPNTELARVDPATDFCTPEWGALVRDSVAADPAFRSSLSTWDGTIGLRSVDGGSSAREVHLRIYRGQIIDVTRRVPGGATFTFVAPAHTWVELMLGERNDFMRRAISGEFSSVGNGYEYLRLTKPLNLIIAHGRAIAKEAS